MPRRSRGILRELANPLYAVVFLIAVLVSYSYLFGPNGCLHNWVTSASLTLLSTQDSGSISLLSWVSYFVGIFSSIAVALYFTIMLSMVLKAKKEG
jgi:hypothetical protein